jgi:hypothetical protein
MSLPRTKSAWLFFAVTSGACAAFNGVFAKLYAPAPLPRRASSLTQHSTTTELTGSWSAHVSAALGLGASNKAVEVAIRAVCHILPAQSHAASRRNPL